MWFDKLLNVMRFSFNQHKGKRFEDFNCPTPQDMPLDFFPRIKRLDYDSAIKADVSKQNVSSGKVRCWYIDAWFDCEQCGKEFCWNAKTQQNLVDFFYKHNLHLASDFDFTNFCCPNICQDCKTKRRKYYEHWDEYARMARIAILSSTDLKTKLQTLVMLNEIEQLSDTPLPNGIAEKREILIRQIEKMKSS